MLLVVLVDLDTKGLDYVGDRLVLTDDHDELHSPTRPSSASSSPNSSSVTPIGRWACRSYAEPTSCASRSTAAHAAPMWPRRPAAASDEPG